MKNTFLKYVIPSVASMWVYSLYTIADGIFVAKGVGELALAAINLSMPIINATFALSVLFAIGSSTVVAIYLGQNEHDKAESTFTCNIVTIIGIWAIFAFISLMNLDKLAVILGATESTFDYVRDYLSIILIFSCFPMVSYYMEVLVKVDGFPKLSTIGVCTAAACNIFLDYILVIRLNMGVRGAAIATGISQVLSATLFFLYFVSKKSHINFAKFTFSVKELFRTLSLGFSDFITELSTGVIIFMFNKTILAVIGESGIVVYTVIVYVNTLIIMTMIGVSQGMQPLVSYNYGRNDTSTLVNYFVMAIKTVSIFSFASFFICIVFAEKINGFFINAEEASMIAYAVKCFRMYATAFLILGFNIIFIGFYTAIERQGFAMIISLGRGFVIIFITLIVIIKSFGANGIWAVTAVSEGINLLICLTLFFKYFYRPLFKNNPRNTNINELS